MQKLELNPIYKFFLFLPLAVLGLVLLFKAIIFLNV